VIGHPVEDVDVEGLSDLIARKIFETVVDDETIASGRPWLLGSESPFDFVAADFDGAGNLAVWADDFEHPL